MGEIGGEWQNAEQMNQENQNSTWGRWYKYLESGLDFSLIFPGSRVQIKAFFRVPWFFLDSRWRIWSRYPTEIKGQGSRFFLKISLSTSTFISTIYYNKKKTTNNFKIYSSEFIDILPQYSHIYFKTLFKLSRSRLWSVGVLSFIRQINYSFDCFGVFGLENI